MKTILKSLAIGLMALTLSGCYGASSFNVLAYEQPTAEACADVAKLDKVSRIVESGANKGKTIAGILVSGEAVAGFSAIAAARAFVDDKLRSAYHDKCGGK